MTKKRGGLGRGLGALIPSDHSASTEEGGVKVVPVTAVSPNPHQPRTHMDEEKLNELAESIREHGLIQPLIVTPQRSASHLRAIAPAATRTAVSRADERPPPR